MTDGINDRRTLYPINNKTLLVTLIVNTSAADYVCCTCSCRPNAEKDVWMYRIEITRRFQCNNCLRKEGWDA